MKGAVTVQQLDQYNAKKKPKLLCRMFHSWGGRSIFKVRDFKGTHQCIAQKCRRCEIVRVVGVIKK